MAMKPFSELNDNDLSDPTAMKSSWKYFLYNCYSSNFDSDWELFEKYSYLRETVVRFESFNWIFFQNDNVPGLYMELVEVQNWLKAPKLKAHNHYFLSHFLLLVIDIS
jgi:hypothetical protein